jgi:hypothetical protein
MFQSLYGDHVNQGFPLFITLLLTGNVEGFCVFLLFVFEIFLLRLFGFGKLRLFVVFVLGCLFVTEPKVFAGHVSTGLFQSLSDPSRHFPSFFGRTLFSR